MTRYRDIWSRYRYIPILIPISGFPISGHSRYRDSRYRVCPDIGIPDIGKYPISGICNIVPDIGFNIGIYRYREIMSRYRVWQGSRCCSVKHRNCSTPGPGPHSGSAGRLPGAVRTGTLFGAPGLGVGRLGPSGPAGELQVGMPPCRCGLDS